MSNTALTYQQLRTFSKVIRRSLNRYVNEFEKQLLRAVRKMRHREPYRRVKHKVK